MKTIQMKKNKMIYQLTLQRPEVRNAFNPLMIAEMTQVFKELHKDPHIRALVIRGEGKSFCAGGDLNWMKSMIQYSKEENRKDAQNLYEMYEALAEIPVPVIALIHGHAMGGGLGIVAACDMAFAVKGALMSFSETRLGLAPSVISPFVARKIKMGDLCRYFLTAEVFGCKQAMQMGLIQGWGPVAEIENQVTQLCRKIANNAPMAVRNTKALILKSCDFENQKKQTTELLASLRISEEGQEGLKAFLEKRKPSWAEFSIEKD